MDTESVNFATSKASIKARKELVRPLSRKDIFYSGSVVNLPEYQSQRSIAGYRQSVISLSASRYTRPDADIEEPPPRKFQNVTWIHHVIYIPSILPLKVTIVKKVLKFIVFFFFIYYQSSVPA